MNAGPVEVVVTHDGVELARHALPPGEYLLGREADCALRFDDEEISARHARLRLAENGKASVEDLGSASGTFLNGQPISGATPWPPGARLRLGATVLTLGQPFEQPTVAASIYTPPSPSPIGSLDSAPSAAGGGDLLRRQLHLTERQAQKLEIGREVARGGMGAVRTARESATRRTVAMKVMLRPDHPQDSVRFISEARITARLEHPNIVPIYDLGIDEQGQPFYTMKLVEGITLMRVLQLLKEGVAETVARYPLAALLTIFQKLCDALAFAHARGVIHRDLKPANIMLGKYGEVLVMDWGLAKIVGHQEEPSRDGATASGISVFTNSPLDEEESFNTQVGAIVGTPQYMSPEQARDETLDARSDVFVLGAILFEILTLERAFSGRSAAEIISKVADYTDTPLPVPQKALPHLPGGEVPESLTAVVRKAMARDTALRYASVSELQRDIEAYQNGFATRAENAGLGRQIRLLIQRHKGVFSTVAAAWLIITALGLWFIVNLHASEKKARRSEHQALVEKEAARRSLAQSQISLADEAFRRADVTAMVQALEACPEDFRDQTWQYLSAKRDASIGDFKVAGFETPVSIAEVPGHAGQFALANDQGDIGLVNVITGRLLRTIKTGRPGIKSIILSGDGRQLGVGRSKPAEVELYDASTGARLKTLPLPGDVLQQFHLGRDASLLAVILGVATEKMELLLIDAHTGATRWKHNGQFSSVIVHPDGDRLLVAGNNRNRTFTLVKVQDGTEISKMTAFVFCQALSPDGKIAAVGTQSGELHLLDSATGAELQHAKLHSAALRELGWLADGHLVTMGAEGKLHDGRWVLKLWDPANWASSSSFFGLKSGAPIYWRLSAENGDLLTEENPPRLWRIPLGREAVKIPQLAEQSWSGLFLTDTILLARKALVLTRYDLSALAKPVELPGTLPNSYCIAAYHPPSGLIALGKNLNNEPFGLKVFSYQKAGVAENFSKQMQGRVHGLDFDPSGERVATVFQGGSVIVYSAKSGEMLLKVPGKFEQAVFAGVPGNFVALNAVTVTTEAVAYDLLAVDGSNGKTLATVPIHFRINTLVASPDRKLVALGGTDMTVHIFDAATLQERFTFRAHNGEIGALAFHPTAPILATASIDGTVKLWDYRSARLLDYYLGLTGTPSTLAFSPNGRLLLEDGQEKTTRIYDVSDVKAP